MKPFTKKILFAVGLFVVGGIMIASAKIEKLSAIFKRMNIKPFSLPRKITFSEPNNLGIPKKVSFLLDLKIMNPDFESFTASGFGVAKLKTIDVYFKNNHIGTATVNLDEIDIPPKSEYILKDLQVNGNTFSILSNATEFTNLSLDHLTFIATVEVLGIDYEIGN